MIKRLLLVLFISFCFSSIYAQISLTATVGTLSGTYTTLKGAFDAINLGTHRGLISISVTGNTTETAMASLNASGSGSSSYTRITIQPSGGLARSITGNLATSLIQFTGASNISINGLNTGGNTLTFENTGAGTNSAAFLFINDASTDSIQNSILKGSCTSATNGVVLFSTTSGTTGNDNNVISGCTFKPSGTNNPIWDIYALGTSAKENSGNIITNNNFEDFYGNATKSGGIWISTYTSNLTISYNHFYWTSAKTTATNRSISAITISNNGPSGIGFDISNNYIGGSARYCGGSPLTVSIAVSTVTCTFYGIQINSYNPSQSATLSKNKINNFLWRSASSATTVPGVWNGIYSTNFSGLIGGTIGNGNIIGCANGTDSIIVELSNSVSGTLVSGIDISAFSASVKNNLIGGITIKSITTAGVASATNGAVFRGIGISSFSSIVVDSNIIGNYTANNIKFGTAVTSTTVNNVLYGICNSSGTDFITISNNIIQNFSNNYSPSSAVSFPAINGICCLGGFNTISGNTIRSLTTSANCNGTNDSSSVIGIGVNASGSSGPITSISNNRIINLSNTNASSAASIVGIYFKSGVMELPNVIERNFIQGLKCTGTGLSIYGISLNSTTVTVRNNMIRLGTTEAGVSIILNASMIGINSNASTTSIFNNSICISGVVPASTLNTYAMNISSSSTTNDIRNNIISNQRFNASGSALHYLVKSTVGATLNLNYNVYFKSGTTCLFSNGTTDFTNFRLWREALATSQGMDVNSVIYNPSFTSIAVDSGSIGLNISGSASPVEGTGASITSVTTDYYGNTRSTLTPNDIGAHAGNFTSVTSDIWQPTFVYTVLPNTTLFSNRSITVAITDIGGGVYKDTNTNSPRIRFRRSYPSASSWVSVPGTLITGTIYSGTWNFNFDYSLLGITPIVGDTIQYYFIAMDSTTNNIWYSPFVSASHTSPGAAITAPTNPNSYCIVLGLGGLVSVNTANTPNGVTQFTSLTGAAPGGLFASLNASQLRGNLFAIISSDLLEPGTYALNEFLNDSIYANVQIISDGTLRTIYNAVDITTALIRISGADRIIIDGGSGQKLLFRNTNALKANARSAILFDSTAVSDTVRNCILENNSSSTMAFFNTPVISVYLIGDNNVYIKSNKIRGATGGSLGSAAIGAEVRGTSIVSLVDNEFCNDSILGVRNYASGTNIIGNSFYFTSSTATANWNGIYTFNPCTIDGNFFGGSSAYCGGAATTFTANTSTVICINALNASNSSDGIIIINNTIQNISMTGTTNSTFKGIYTEGNVHVGYTSGGGNLIGHSTNSNSITIGSGSASTLIYGIQIASISSLSHSYSSNTIANLTVSSTSISSLFRGIYVVGSWSSTGNDTIANNTIYNLNSNSGHNYTIGSESVGGIFYDGNGGNSTTLIQNNTIHGLSDNGTTTLTSKVTGIYFARSGTNSRIKGNKVYDLYNNRATGSITGILMYFDSAVTVLNNMVSLNNDTVTSNVNVIGILDSCSSTSAAKYFYNSVYIGGTLSASNNWSATFYKSNGSITEVKNNLFYNEITGGTGLGNFSIASSTTTNWTSNYNLLISANASQVAYWNTIVNDFTSYQSSATADANSMYETAATIPVDSIFTDKTNGDLTIPINSRHAWYVNGTGIPITGFADDYNGTAVRSTAISTGASDIGADEVILTTIPSLSTMTLISGTISNGSTQVYNFGSRQFLNITWYGTGLPTSALVSYLPGSYNMVSCSGKNQSDAYFYIEPSGATGNALTDWYYTVKIFYDEATLRAMNEGASNFGLAKRTTAGNCASWQVFDTTNSGSPTQFFVDYTSNFIGRREAHTLGFFGISDRTAPLPVKLISFNAILQGNQVELDWHTATEINNDHFDIERSDDGIHYRKIGEVKGAYTTYQKQHYHFIDINPIVSTVYYRLKQVDINENFEYSNVEVVQANSRNSAIVSYPNPCTTEINLPITSIKNQTALVSIYNAQGVLVSKNNIDCSKGANVSKIAVQDLPSGYYIIRIGLEEANYTTSMMKQ